MLWLGCFFIGANAETGLHALKPGEGVESVEGFCRGLNALDEFSDMASQLLNRKYPQLGPIRVGGEQKKFKQLVSLFENNDYLSIDKYLDMKSLKVLI